MGSMQGSKWQGARDRWWGSRRTAAAAGLAVVALAGSVIALSGNVGAGAGVSRSQSSMAEHRPGPWGTASGGISTAKLLGAAGAPAALARSQPRLKGVIGAMPTFKRTTGSVGGVPTIPLGSRALGPDPARTPISVDVFLQPRATRRP